MSSVGRKCYVLKNGLKIKHYEGINLEDLHFDFAGETKEFSSRHNKIFQKLISENENLHMEQANINSLSRIIELARKNTDKEISDEIVAELHSLRVNFAKRLSVLFDHIEGMEKILD